MEDALTLLKEWCLDQLLIQSLKDLNKEIDDKNFLIPNDSVCLEPNGDAQIENNEKIVSPGDLSMIGLVPAGQPKNMHYATCDTVALLGERAESNTPIALPLPQFQFCLMGKSSPEEKIHQNWLNLNHSLWKVILEKLTFYR